MKVDVLVAEIGSTTTVVNAFHGLDGDRPVYLGQGQAPTSVLDGDVRIGLQSAVSDLCGKLGTESLEYREMLATSSAAGGLKMTVHGLVYDMTLAPPGRRPWAREGFSTTLRRDGCAGLIWPRSRKYAPTSF